MVLLEHENTQRPLRDSEGKQCQCQGEKCLLSFSMICHRPEKKRVFLHITCMLGRHFSGQFSSLLIDATEY